VQLALAAGARVIGTAAPRDHDFLRGFGAEPVAYGDGLEERVRALAPDGVTAALDTVGSDEAIDVSVAVVADRDRVATIAGFGRGAAAGIRLLGGGPGADPGEQVRMAARLDLVRAVSAGTLRVVVESTFPLEDVVAAHAHLRSPRPPGKIALTID
jgi:NADPH:quinone reductase-like Zn-dependent oxidoreductase